MEISTSKKFKLFMEKITNHLTNINNLTFNKQLRNFSKFVRLCRMSSLGSQIIW